MEQNAPRLRFTGFSGTWEKKKLGEIAKIISGGTPKTNVKEYWNGNINWYSPVEIGNSIYVSNSQRKITKEGLKNSSATILPATKTILFTSRAGIGSMAILKTPGATNQGFQSIVVNDDIAPYFIYSAGDIIKRKAKKVASGSTFLEISHKNMQELEIYIPSLPEQEKIADFFFALDEKIDLKEKEIEDVKSMKKGFLQKMFPQDEESVPRLRFPGFSGEWEKKALEDLVSIHARIGWQNLRTSEFLSEGDYYLITGTDFDNGKINFKNCYYVDKERYEQDPHIQVSENSILITKDGTIGKVAYISKINKPGTLNAGVFCLKATTAEIYMKYLFQYLYGPFLMQYAKKHSTGGTIQHLNQGMLVKLPVPIPSLPEQEKIADFFSALDEKIDAMEKQLEDLKTLKKGFLQRMFI